MISRAAHPAMQWGLERNINGTKKDITVQGTYVQNGGRYRDRRNRNLRYTRPESSDSHTALLGMQSKR